MAEKVAENGTKPKGLVRKHISKLRDLMREIKWDVLALYLARKDPRVPL